MEFKLINEVDVAEAVISVNSFAAGHDALSIDIIK